MKVKNKIPVVKLHPEQKKIANGLINNLKKFNIIRCSRQFGKSILLEQVSIYYLINKPGIKLMYVTPYYVQCNKVMKDIIKQVEDSGVVKKIDRKFPEIQFNNGSTILFRSSENMNAIRGENFDILIVDEFCFLKNLCYKEVLLPIMGNLGRKNIICSTPRGKDDFYDFYLYSLENKEDYISYHADYTMNPYADVKYIEDMKNKLMKYQFDNEYLALFNLEGGSVFNLKDCIREDLTLLTASECRGKKLYAGIDVGKSIDATVLSIVDENNKLVFYHRMSKIDYTQIVDKCISILKDFRPVWCYVEANGPGDVFFDFMYKKYKNVSPVFNTGNKKEILIENLVAAFGNSELLIPSEAETLINELNSFDYTINKETGKIRFSARLGMHDDCVLSLAYAYLCKKEKFRRGLSIAR